MALKETIQSWNEAVILYANGDFSQSLHKLSTVPVSSKICYNQGIVSWRLNKIDDSLQYFSKAIQLDSFLAVAYFQRAWIQFSLHRFSEADQDLQFAETYLRGSHVIDYKQLGLPVKLHAIQILYNRAVVRKSMNDAVTIQNLLSQIKKCTTDDLNFSEIDINKMEKMVHLHPKFALFSPPKSMVSNLIKKDFLGKSQLISSVHDVDYDERKSSSTPVSPANMRKNNLTVSTDRRMALTPPPTRPPPRVKSQDELNHNSDAFVTQTSHTHKIEISKSSNRKEMQKEITMTSSLSQSMPKVKYIDPLNSVNPGRGYSDSQTRSDLVKCVPQRPVPLLKSHSYTPKIPVPQSKSVPRHPLGNFEKAPKAAVPSRPVPMPNYSTQVTASTTATKTTGVPPLTRTPPKNQPIPLNRNKEKPSRPPPPVLKTS